MNGLKKILKSMNIESGKRGRPKKMGKVHTDCRHTNCDFKGETYADLKRHVDKHHRY